MLDPFDSEFLSQELRDAWKKIERLEEENRNLQEELDWYKLQEELDEERREYDNDSWENDNLIGDRHEMGG